MSTRKLGTYATREEFLENEIRTLNYHIQSMIDTMKVMSMNRQDMSDELERMKQEIKSAVLAEREACAKICEDSVEEAGDELAWQIRARGQA
jgi:predicted RNase H-like nuclease (RuvC/YqgF family)